jgi:hypothetical protein
MSHLDVRFNSAGKMSGSDRAKTGLEPPNWIAECSHNTLQVEDRWTAPTIFSSEKGKPIFWANH